MATATQTCQHVWDGPDQWDTSNSFPTSTCSLCGLTEEEWGLKKLLGEEAGPGNPNPIPSTNHTSPGPAAEPTSPTSTATSVSVAKRQLRFVTDGYSKWARDIQPQPDFGSALTGWMEANGLDATKMAEKVGCTAPTVRKWMLGFVPAPESRGKIRELGFAGDFHPLKWDQRMFVGSELVQMKNGHWAEGMDPDRQLIEKYLVRCLVPKVVARGRGKNRVVQRTEEAVDFLFATRVSDVIAIISKGDALTDWTVCQALAEGIGEPVLQGVADVDGVMTQVEIRGTWRKIKSWEKKCVSCRIILDTSRSRVKPWSLYHEGELLEFHREAFHAKYRKRDEAGQHGTRAHKMGQAWIQYHHLQDRDENGLPLIDRIRAPKHFWNKESDSEEIEDNWLGFESQEVQNAIKALQTFWIANELTLVATEELLADLYHGVAGAVDCVVRDKHGKLLILDWKTSNGIFSNMFVQVSWYTRLWWLCHGEMPERAYIVRLDKTTAAVQVVPVFDTPEKRDKRLATALRAVELLRDNQEIESEIAEYGPED